MGSTKTILKRATAYALAFVMAFSMLFTGNNVVTTNAAATVTKLTVKKSKVTIDLSAKSKIAKVKVTVKGSNKKFTVKSNKKSIATVKVVNKNAVITGKKVGTAKITVTTKGKNKKNKKLKKTITVTVINSAADQTAATNAQTIINNLPASTTVTKADEAKINEARKVYDALTPDQKALVPADVVKKLTDAEAALTEAKKTVAVTSVSVAATSSTIDVGKATVVTATVLPADATDKTVKFTSSAPAVATVNESTGVVTGISAGTAVITASTNNGQTATVTITVVNIAVTKIDVTGTNSITVTGTTTLSASITPADATDKTVTWTSSDEKIATVGKDTGVVTGVAAGKATITATSSNGITGTFEVTVTAENVIADGITIEVTNPYKDNEGNVYDNTVLVGRNMSVRVRAVKDNKPLGNVDVTLDLDPLYGTRAAKDAFEIKGDTTKDTKDDGYQTFTIGLKSGYDYTAVSGQYHSFKLIATSASVSFNESEYTLPVRFASIELPDIEVLNGEIYNEKELPPIAPKAGYNVGDGTWWTTATNATAYEQYVVSQQTSSKEDDHRVYFSAQPYIILPAISTEQVNNKWEYKVDKNSGPVSVYNDATNKTTTVTVNDIPAGLQYVNVDFDEIDISEYTMISVDIYAKDNTKGVPAGELLGHEEIISAQNTDKTRSVTLSRTADVASYVVVSYLSEGQVDAANTGYNLTKIWGTYKTTDAVESTREPLKKAVTWTINTEDVTFNETVWSSTQAAAYLPESAVNASYTYKYLTPAFPYTGDAYITVTDGAGKYVGYYLYPSINQYNGDNNIDNKNVIEGSEAFIDAVYSGDAEMNGKVGTLDTDDAVAIVDSQNPGRTNLNATIKINGLKDSELNINNGSSLNTSVQWTNVENLVTDEVTPDFYAIEGQEVTVTAQLIDKNDHPATSAGNITVNFYVGDVLVTNGAEVGGKTVGDEVYPTANVFGYPAENKTDDNGKISFTLKGSALSAVENITAKCDTGTYNVKLYIGSDTTNLVNSANIYWVDLGTLFVDKATVGSTHTEWFGDKLETIKKSSSSQVGKTWNIAYLPIAESAKFDYDYDDNTSEGKFVSVSGVTLDYNNGSTIGTVKSQDNLAVVTSTSIGTTKINGFIDKTKLDADYSNVKFTFVDETGNVVTRNNVGTGATAIVEGSSGMSLNFVWSEKGEHISLIIPGSTDNKNATIDMNTDVAIYAKVVDDYGNPLKERPVKFSYTLNNVTTSSEDNAGATYQTDAKGMFTFNIPAPKKTGMLTGSVTVDENFTVPFAITYTNNTDKSKFNIGYEGTDVKIVDKNKIIVYLNNPVNKSTINKNMFKFVQTDSETTYVVESVAPYENYANQVILTLDKDIVNMAAQHTLTIKSYLDESNGVEYYLMDAYGQRYTGIGDTTFIPSEKQ